MIRNLTVLTKVLSTVLLVTALFFMGGAAGGSVPSAAASSGSPGDMVDGLGTAQFTTTGSAAPLRTANTIPYWSSSFTDPTNGVTYPYTMVGTDPSLGPAKTTVSVVIIPFNFVFTTSASADNALDGSSKLNLTTASPIFKNASFKSGSTSVGSTQYGDAIQKGSFWYTGGSSSGYHVLLGSPKVLPTQTFTVPANQGQLVVGSVSGRRIGLISESWFTNRLLNTVNNLHIPATTLPIILTYNTFLYEHSVGNCCILGYHGAGSSFNGNGQQQVQTFMFAAYSDPGIFRSSYIQDIHALSHEVSEWYADPFINNQVNPWLTPTAPQYGCTSYLEVGDPVVGVGFTVNLNGTTYHPEDEVFFSWFAREAPSRGINHYYTWLNTFPNVAQGCQ